MFKSQKPRNERYYLSIKIRKTACGRLYAAGAAHNAGGTPPLSRIEPPAHRHPDTLHQTAHAGGAMPHHCGRHCSSGANAPPLLIGLRARRPAPLLRSRGLSGGAYPDGPPLRGPLVARPLRSATAAPRSLSARRVSRKGHARLRRRLRRPCPRPRLCGGSRVPPALPPLAVLRPALRSPGGGSRLPASALRRRGLRVGGAFRAPAGLRHQKTIRFYGHIPPPVPHRGRRGSG